MGSDLGIAEDKLVAVVAWDEHRDLFASNRGVFVKLSYGWQP